MQNVLEMPKQVGAASENKLSSREMIDLVMKFVPTHQLDALVKLGLDASVDALLGIVEHIRFLPDIFAQDGLRGEAKAYLHYFGAGVDIYVTGYDGYDTVSACGSFRENCRFENKHHVLDVDTQLIDSLEIQLDLRFDPIPLKWIEDPRNPYYSK
jgi:hypothetical protein